MDSGAMLQAVEANIVSSTWKASQSPMWFVTFMASAKATEQPKCAPYNETIAKVLTLCIKDIT